MFLGENLIVYLVLALGGALAVGNIAALMRPRPQRTTSTTDEDVQADDLVKAPVMRSVVMAVIGATAAVWAAASLIGG